MSEVSSHITATLLPQSSVAIYSRDNATLEAARSLAQDWRFARVSLQAEQGDVEAAITAYTEYKSPDIVIVQTDVIDDGFVGRLEELASNCDEGTEAIVIGPDNDVYLYRKLIDMGVSDYLVRPVTQEILSEVIAKTLIHQHGVSGSQLIAFIGAKGGVGASTLVRATGWVLSGYFQQKTLLLDASGGWSSHPVGIGYEPSATFAEISKAVDKNDQDSLARMMFKAGDKFSVLSSGADTMLEPVIAKDKMEAVLEKVMIKNPVVLVDLSGASPELKKTVLARANRIVLVSTPTVSCLRLARSLAIEIKAIRGGKADDIALVLNMQGLLASSEVPKSDCELAMELKVAASIPFDPKTFIPLESEGKSIMDDKAGKPLVDGCFVPFVKNTLGFGKDEDVTAQVEEGNKLLSGILGKLGKK